MANYNQQGENNPNYKHGRAGMPEYNAWYGMHQRCINPNNKDFKNYGGRGITVCEGWNNFETFFTNMGARPKDLSVDRVDNNKGYYPENCRWATRAEQSQNQRIRTTNKTGVNGVYFDQKRQKYRAQIYSDGKRHCLGLFATVPEAALARKQGEARYLSQM